MAANLDYLAGYLDANGCFSIARTKPRGKEPHNYVSQIIVHSRKDHQMLYELAEEFGGSVHRRAEKDTSWHITANTALQLCQILKPKLRSKRSQAICIIQLQKLKTGKYRTRSDIQRQEWLYNEIQRLKK